MSDTTPLAVLVALADEAEHLADAVGHWHAGVIAMRPHDDPAAPAPAYVTDRLRALDAMVRSTAVQALLAAPAPAPAVTATADSSGSAPRQRRWDSSAADALR